MILNYSYWFLNTTIVVQDHDLNNLKCILHVHQVAWKVIWSHETHSNMEAVVCNSKCPLNTAWVKAEDFVVSPSDNIETIQTECQNVTTVTQMLANRLQGSFIPQIKRIPPSKDISFNLLWIKCQCCYAMILFFETSAVVFPIHIKFRTKWKKSRNRFTHRFCHLLVLKMVH